MELLLTYPYEQQKIKKIEDLGYKVYLNTSDQIKSQNKYKDVEVLICNNPFQTLDLKRMENLKWIQLISAGSDRAPLVEIQKNNIILTTAGNAYSTAIAEWIIAKIMELYKKNRYYYHNQINKKWKKDRDIREITNKKILFYGTGSIAQATAARLKAFNTKLYGINSNGRSVKDFDKCYKLNSAEEIIKKADINIITLPLTAKTKHLIDYDILKIMKNDSLIINISRGEIIDENSLIELLKQEYFYGAVLDVFEEEPLSKDNPLWQMDNVIISPHVSYASEYRFKRVFNVIYDNLERYKQGEELRNIVDLDRGY